MLRLFKLYLNPQITYLLKDLMLICKEILKRSPKEVADLSGVPRG